MSNIANPFSAPTNYFVCTLGEALGKSPDLNDLNTVNDFFDHRSKTSGKDFAVGFPVLAPAHSDHHWHYEIFTFDDLRNGSIFIAAELAPIISRDTGNSGPACVALLCPSSMDFLFAWLGLMRAGLSVLLIAPQCQPIAIAHLCKSCGASVLLHHELYNDLASKAVSEPDSGLLAIGLPWQVQGMSITDMIRSPKLPSKNGIQRDVSAFDNAFIFHTSGTSTGLPKPIPQSHHAAFRVLPVLDGRDAATFTTTPLYHGGIADCFRAWTSGALIWLFPGADKPITTQNVLCCLSIAEEAASAVSAAHIKYFSCVPLILQMIIQDALGVSLLQNMEIVGVGGAALSLKIGDELIEKGVNLVSRFGSAECGFLLSSHRDYKMDRDWQYLRYSSNAEFLCFEEQTDSSKLFELIVKSGWPHMTKTNREDGSFATSDLFERHPFIDRAWKYHSRSDSQITLSTGKKFDPAPMEDAIAASNALIREVYVFGSGEQEAGILVFPSADGSKVPESKFEESVWEVIQHHNIRGQDHTRISRSKVAIMSGHLSELDRSSKGTLLRGVIEKKFAVQIERVYDRGLSLSSELPQKPVDLNDIKSSIRRIFIDLTGNDFGLDDDDDFYAHGIDSATCTRMRLLLQKNLFPGRDSLPWNIVYDCGNINRLAHYILDLRTGNASSETDPAIEMFELVKKHTVLDFGQSAHNGQQEVNKTQNVVLLTGATGVLGAHILDNLRKSSSTYQIICLVRAADHLDAHSRVSESLIKRIKGPLDISDTKVWCLPCNIGVVGLGLSDMELSYIRRHITHVIHAAWAVNFSLPLRSFVDEHITGIHNMLNLTISCRKSVTFLFCSSTASVLGPNNLSIIEEKVSLDPSDAGSTGYSRSKWVAEAILSTASMKLPGTVKILRIGQLTGSTNDGVWNMSEAWPLMLSTVNSLNCLPNIKEPLNWLPVDVAATAIVDIAFQRSQSDGDCHVYHLVNNSTDSTWSDLLKWIKEIRLKPFKVVPIATWLDKIEGFPHDLPAKNLLGLWKTAYANYDENKQVNLLNGQTVFSTAKARNESDAMLNVRPIDDIIVKKIWSWMEVEGSKSNVVLSTAK